jgi:TonB family protein
MSYDPILCRTQRVVAAGGPNAPSVFATHDATFFSRRTMVFVAILAIHAAAVYGLVSAHSRNIRPLVPPPTTQGRVLVQPLPSEKPLLKSPSVATITQVDARLSEIPFVPIDVSGPPVDTAVQVGNLLPPGGNIETRTVTRLPGGPGAGFPDARDFYSAEAIRRGQFGVAAVRVCVDGSGRLTSTPVIAISSGYPILDGDALAVAKAGNGHYRSTTEDGVAVSDCYSYRIRFELH